VSIASAVVRAILAGSLTVSADLTSGETKGRWSTSWSDPMPQRISGARPPRVTSGTPSAWAEAIALIPFVTPQPAVSAQIPGSRVAFAQPIAAKAADCSWRVSTTSIPASLQPS
jgi:hypothetical protein